MSNKNNKNPHKKKKVSTFQQFINAYSSIIIAIFCLSLYSFIFYVIKKNNNAHSSTGTVKKIAMPKSANTTVVPKKRTPVIKCFSLELTPELGDGNYENLYQNIKNMKVNDVSNQVNSSEQIKMLFDSLHLWNRNR